MITDAKYAFRLNAYNPRQSRDEKIETVFSQFLKPVFLLYICLTWSRDENLFCIFTTYTLNLVSINWIRLFIFLECEFLRRLTGAKLEKKSYKGDIFS